MMHCKEGESILPLPLDTLIKLSGEPPFGLHVLQVTFSSPFYCFPCALSSCCSRQHLNQFAGVHTISQIQQHTNNKNDNHSYSIVLLEITYSIAQMKYGQSWPKSLKYTRALLGRGFEPSSSGMITKLNNKGLLFTSYLSEQWQLMDLLAISTGWVTCWLWVRFLNPTGLDDGFLGPLQSILMVRQTAYTCGLLQLYLGWLFLVTINCFLVTPSSFYNSKSWD